MDVILDFINDNQLVLVVALIIVNLILLFLQLLNKIELNRMEKRYKKLMKGSTGKSIEEMIIDYKNNIDASIDTVKRIESLYDDVDKRVKKSIQKFAVVRYRAFDDVGSDLSFSIALLDEKNDGVVITGIYGRTESTSFAKPIESGISKYDLSEEEKLAIKKAIEGRN